MKEHLKQFDKMVEGATLSPERLAEPRYETPLTKLTKEQAALIGLFTGITCGPFSDIHRLAEQVLGRPIWTHQFANPELWDELKTKVKEDFISICYEEKKNEQAPA